MDVPNFIVFEVKDSEHYTPITFESADDFACYLHDEYFVSLGIPNQLVVFILHPGFSAFIPPAFRYDCSKHARRFDYPALNEYMASGPVFICGCDKDKLVSLGNTTREVVEKWLI